MCQVEVQFLKHFFGLNKNNGVIKNNWKEKSNIDTGMDDAAEQSQQTDGWEKNL